MLKPAITGASSPSRNAVRQRQIRDYRYVRCIIAETKLTQAPS
jgi:hypothetical protein